MLQLFDDDENKAISISERCARDNYLNKVVVHCVQTWDKRVEFHISQLSLMKHSLLCRFLMGSGDTIALNGPFLPKSLIRQMNPTKKCLSCRVSDCSDVLQVDSNMPAVTLPARYTARHTTRSWSWSTGSHRGWKCWWTCRPSQKTYKSNTHGIPTIGEFLNNIHYHHRNWSKANQLFSCFPAGRSTYLSKKRTSSLSTDIL